VNAARATVPAHDTHRVHRIGHLRRYREIVRVLVTYGFVDVVHALHLTAYLAAGRRMLAFAARREVTPERSRAQRLRLALEALGPTFIKFGQALSTHADLLPADVIAELALLQDSVPPLPPGVAERAIEEALGRPLKEVFAEFEAPPLAAASIAQVHRAVLPSGELVAVKIRRPGIEAIIEADLAVLADLAALADRHMADAALYNLPALVEEFARTIRREQDLAREGRLITRIAAQFDRDETVRFPRICWRLTTPAVLTMEFLDGVKVSAVGTPSAPDLDPRIVARRGADAVLRQVLVHGLFHADPHPGNILVLPGNVVAFIDFGIVGRVNRQMRRHVADTILAIGQYNAERLAEIVAKVAVPLQPIDAAALIGDLEELLDSYADVPLGELSLRDVFTSISATMSRHRLQLPSDLLLLIKAVATIESVGRQLDPSFKMVEHAQPLVERLMVERHRPRALAHRTAEAGHAALKTLTSAPRDVAYLIRKARGEGLQIQFIHRNLDYFIREMDRASNRLSFAIVIAAIVIGSAVVVHAGIGPQMFGYAALGLAGFIGAGVLGIGLALGVLRSGRL
jgi:ubiquinone biosynthesis protein